MRRIRNAKGVPHFALAMAGSVQPMTRQGEIMWNHVSDVLNQALDRTVNAAVNFLPGLLALVIIVLFATVIAFVLRIMIRRSLEGIHFDRHVASWGFAGIAEWSPARSASLLMARITFW